MSACFLPHRGIATLGILVCLGWLDGCGSGGPPSGTVSGKVTLNGQPLSDGVVVFTDSAAGVGASASLNERGIYHLPSIPVSSYDVAIQPPPAPPPDEMPKVLPKSPIPEPFRDAETSPLKATVNQGPNTADFSL
jgi:hypothetical protein